MVNDTRRTKRGRKVIMHNDKAMEAWHLKTKLEELEGKYAKLNEEVERWIDIHGLDVMQIAKKDKRIKELEGTMTNDQVVIDHYKAQANRRGYR